MAASGFTPVSLYYSNQTGHTPTAGNLVYGELAINIFDGKLFYKDNSNNIQVIAGTGGTGVVAGSNTQVQFNNNGMFGASSGMTWDGSYFTATSIKDSALTSGRVTYAGASGLLQDSANLTFNGTTLIANTLNLTNQLTTQYGGTGLASYTAGDTLYYASGTTLTKLPIGAANYVYTSTGSAPQWVPASSIAAGAAGANTQIQFNSSGVLGAVSTFVYTSTGVGIGTATPLGKLHVVGGNSNNAIIDNGGQQYTTLSWYNNGTEKAQTYWDQTNTLFVSGTDVSAAYVFKTNGTERMRIGGSSGNVSIGTASTPIKFLVNSTDAIGLPVGTTSQRPTGAAGYIRLNSETNKFEGFNNSNWTQVGGGATGGGSDAIFWENGQSVTTNYTITTGTNAGTFGPITIDAGVTVTVPDGSVWSIV